MKKITSANYTKDQLYPKVARAVAEMIDTGGAVTPVELLMRMERLTKERYEDWRFGRTAYLERVCIGNLSKLNRLLRILDLHARALGLKPSQTVYHKWGRGGKRIVLRFSKSGDPKLEAAYSRHYLTKKASAANASRDKPKKRPDAPAAAQPEEAVT